MKTRSRTLTAGAPTQPVGRREAQIINQWVWNLRLELGHQLHPTPMRLTEFAQACAVEPVQVVESIPMETPAQVVESIQAVEPTQAIEPAQVTHSVSYGPPQWARSSYTKGFAGSDFRLLPDGTLRCPADHPLYPSERRRERNGSLRVLYAARGCRIAVPVAGACSVKKVQPPSDRDALVPSFGQSRPPDLMNQQSLRQHQLSLHQHQ